MWRFKILTFFSLIYDPLFLQQVYKRIFTRFFGYANESLCDVMYFFHIFSGDSSETDLSIHRRHHRLRLTSANDVKK